MSRQCHNALLYLCKKPLFLSATLVYDSSGDLSTLSANPPTALLFPSRRITLAIATGERVIRYHDIHPLQVTPKPANQGRRWK